MSTDTFGGLTVLLVKREEDKREHDNHHQHCRRRQVEMRLRQKEVGTPTAAAMEKQISCRLVRLNMTLRFDAVI